MKKNTLYLSALLIIFSLGFAGCEEGHKSAEYQTANSFNSLLDKYHIISLDTLEVYSHGGNSGTYYGVAIDSIEAKLFPKEIADAYFNDRPGLFAVYQFYIDDRVTGLITRSPSMYWPSSIKIFFFNKIKKVITGYVELAETWGDAGDVYIKRSWLYRYNNKLHALVWDMDSHYNGVDDPNDSTEVTHNNYFLLNLSNYTADTISKDTTITGSNFEHLINTATDINE